MSQSQDIALARSVGLRVKFPYAPSAPLLSPQQIEVHRLLKAGLTNREIARMLFISETTAKTHVRDVMRKLGARTRTEAASRLVEFY